MSQKELKERTSLLQGIKAGFQMNGDENKPLPSIRHQASKVFDPSGFTRSRSNSLGSLTDNAELHHAQKILLKEKSPRIGFESVIPNPNVASFTAEGRQEIEKAYQMLRYVRQENEEYQKELLKEKEKSARSKMTIKENEGYLAKLESEQQQSADHMKQLESRLGELERVLVEERKKNGERLAAILSKEKDLETELATTMQNTTNFSKQLNALINRISFTQLTKLSQNQRENDDATPKDAAPMGRIVIVFTDVEDSTSKWEQDPELMRESLHLHNQLIRDLMKTYDGYEVKTEGDSFMVAFADPEKAMKFCLSVQLDLLEAPWPEKALQWPKCEEVKDTNDRILWRGMRVRIGAHIGVPTAVVDPTTGRTDYLGSMVNKAARIAQSAAGGQIVASLDLWEELRYTEVEDEVCATEIGSFQLKGMSEKTTLIQLIPNELSQRMFLPPLHNCKGNDIDTQLQRLVKENRRLKAHLAELEKELKEIVNLSSELDLKYDNIHLKRQMSSRSFQDLLDAVSFKENLSQRLNQLSSKINGYHEDNEVMKEKISGFIDDKNKLIEQRDQLLQKLNKSESEKRKLLLQLARMNDYAPNGQLAPLQHQVSNTLTSSEQTQTTATSGNTTITINIEPPPITSVYRENDKRQSHGHGHKKSKDSIMKSPRKGNLAPLGVSPPSPRMLSNGDEVVNSVPNSTSPVPSKKAGDNESLNSTKPGQQFTTQEKSNNSSTKTAGKPESNSKTKKERTNGTEKAKLTLPLRISSRKFSFSELDQIGRLHTSVVHN